MLRQAASVTYQLIVGDLIMVARNRIRCTIVTAGQPGDPYVSRGALARDVLPWADPYVAQLIRKLQDEVRFERRLRSVMRHSALRAVRSVSGYERAHLGRQIE
jgi:hypothetical protein